MAEIAANVGVSDSTSCIEENEVSASNVTDIDSALLEFDCTETEEPSARDTLSDDKINCVLLLDDNFDDLCNKKTEDEFDFNIDLCNLNINDNGSQSCHASEENQDDLLNVNKAQDDVTVTSVSDKKLFNDSVDEVLRVYSEHEVLSSADVECSDGAKDLIQRLLNPDPNKRLRSLLSLHNIKFFKDFCFADVRTKKISPNEILFRHFPNGPLSMNEEPLLDNTDETFVGFDSDFV